ncbi:carboxypeptidase-like regulatory domain-containing protein, partial [candidate division KSB1 bacterium]|nr:carboxypeptidase-like regulatory domain-containing protein [candidate division KSB1 bacterium]
MKKKTLFFAMVLALSWNGTVLAGITGKLSGRVTDATTREGITAANILIEGTSLGAAADLDGNYYVINIPPGVYTVYIRSMGYTNKRIENVRINVDLTTRLSVELTPTVVDGEEITIVAQRALVEKDLTSSSARVSSDQIDVLPIETVA